MARATDTASTELTGTVMAHRVSLSAMTTMYELPLEVVVYGPTQSM